MSILVARAKRITFTPGFEPVTEYVELRYDWPARLIETFRQSFPDAFVRVERGDRGAGKIEPRQTSFGGQKRSSARQKAPAKPAAPEYDGIDSLDTEALINAELA